MDLNSEVFVDNLILGAGLSGLSASYFIENGSKIILEKKSYSGGHIYSYVKDNFTWDEGPHISFTKNQLVKELLAKSVNHDFNEFPASVSNYYQGSWVPHPAQSHLSYLPDDSKTKCFESFIKARSEKQFKKPSNYQEWSNYAMGEYFTENLVEAYTTKYWCCPTKELSTDWLGERIFLPDIETVKNGYYDNRSANDHYISTFRYPSRGGFNSYKNLFEKKSDIIFGCNISSIDLDNKIISSSHGRFKYKRLIVTIPLPEFLALLTNLPHIVHVNAEKLLCTSLLLVNIETNHTSIVPHQWFYVYDKDFYSTRASQTNLMSPSNSPNNFCGMQVEVYESKRRPFSQSHEFIAKKVVEEMICIQAIRSCVNYHHKYVKYANIVCDLFRQTALDSIWEWLESFGLCREDDDTLPMSNHKMIPKESHNQFLFFAGRFAQWKYFWTDDCILRGKIIAQQINRLS